MRAQLLKIWDKRCTTLLDLGCRDGWHTADLPGITRHVGVEIWPEALERGRVKAAAGGLPHFEGVLDEALAYLKAQEDGAFDAVLAIDLLEHLPKENGLEFIAEMGRVAGRLAVIWTTFGLVSQGPYDVDGNPNPHEEHLWGPMPADFINQGWKIMLYPYWHGDRGGAILSWLKK